MTEHYCQYICHWDDGWAGSTYNGDHQPCDRVARFVCGERWFCADHYDLWVGYDKRYGANFGSK